MFLNMVNFNGEELLTPRPTPKLEDNPSSALCDCFPSYQRPFLHPQPEDAPCRGDRHPIFMGELTHTEQNLAPVSFIGIHTNRDIRKEILLRS